MEIKPKDKFRHFKGGIVEIICIAKNSETLEDMVIYTHDKNIWARPLSMFLDEQDVSKRKDNITGQKYRFEKIRRENDDKY